jgi:hypothetical protein
VKIAENRDRQIDRWREIFDDFFEQSEVRLQHTDRAVKFLVDELKVCPQKEVTATLRLMPILDQIFVDPGSNIG